MQKSTLKEFQQSKTPMEKITRAYGDIRVNDHRDNSQMSFSYYPQFGSTPPEFPAQPMPSYMFPYQNYMGTSMNGGVGSVF